MNETPSSAGQPATSVKPSASRPIQPAPPLQPAQHLLPAHAQPEPHEQPAPRAPRRHWLRWLIILVIAGAVVLGIVMWQRASATDHASAAADASARAVPVATAAARQGDLPIYLNGLGTVTAFATVNVRPRRGRPVDEGRFLGGADRSRGRRDRRNRRSPVQDPARCGAGPARSGRGAAEERAPRSVAQSAGARGGVRAAGGPGGGHRSASTKARSRSTRARSTARTCRSPTAGSPRRRAGGSGCGPSMRETWCTPPTRSTSP